MVRALDGVESRQLGALHKGYEVAWGELLVRGVVTDLNHVQKSEMAD